MTIDQLYQTICARADSGADQSYTASLLAQGTGAVAQKLGEECIELVIEAARLEDGWQTDGKDAFIGEAADLMYHYLVLLAGCGVSPDQVFAELDRRAGQSGLEEKRSRQGTANGQDE